MSKKIQSSGFTFFPLIFLGTLLVGGTSYYGVKKYFGLDNNTGLFMWGCLTRPHENGAFAPCSKYVAEEIVKPLKDVCEQNKQCSRTADTIRILEVGAGSGIFTREIVKTVHSSGNQYLFDVIEINNDYCVKLRQEFRRHDQVTIKCMSVLDFSAPNSYYDFIISSIPLSIFSTEDVKKIFNFYTATIKKGGVLSYIKLRGHQVTQKILQGNHKQQYHERQTLLDDFNNAYNAQRVEVKRNIPPVYVYHCVISQ